MTPTRISATQTSRLSCSSAGPKNGIQSIGSEMSGTCGHAVGRALLAVVVEEHVARDAERDEVDREPAHDLVGPQADREERVDQRQRAARDHPQQEPREPATEHVGAVDAEERAHQHHALEADVHDARALGDHAAQRAEHQRRREPQHRGGQRGPDDDPLEVRLARLRRGDRADPADHPGRHRAPAEALRALAQRPHAEPDRDQREHDRRRRRAQQQRRQRDPPGEDAERDARPSRSSVDRSTPERSSRPRVAVAAVIRPPPDRVPRPAACASAAAGRASSRSPAPTPAARSGP